jgi:hypothetical protein
MDHGPCGFDAKKWAPHECPASTLPQTLFLPWGVSAPQKEKKAQLKLLHSKVCIYLLVVDNVPGSSIPWVHPEKSILVI